MPLDTKGKIHQHPRLLYTLVGIGALILWSLSALLISELQEIPTFELSGIVLFIAFLVVAIKLTIKGEWKKIHQPTTTWITGFIAVLCNQTAYVSAVKLIPPEQAEIIYYLWPVIALLTSALFFENKIRFTPFLSAMLALVGIYILLTDGGSLDDFNMEYMHGYSMAMVSALAWVLYCLFAKYNPDTPLEMNGIWCGMAAPCCFALHLLLEQSVIPSAYEWMLMTIIGVGILSLSLLLWSESLRKGHFHLLQVFAYLTPMLSLLLLIACDKAECKATLFISCQLIVFAGMLCAFVEWLSKREKISEVK